ncbi:MAG: metallophosphoesterase [Planctomycetia bacterium]|jgi:predicted MPP superfamily phosphohydrolase
MHVAAHEKQPDVRVAPRRFSRARLAAFRAVERACVLFGGRAFYRARHLAPGRFLLREERVRVAGLPPALEGFRVAQLSDLHGGGFLGAGDLRHVVAAVEALAPDAVALTGDYITHAIEDSFPLVEDLARLRPRHGVWAVFGNHDYKARREGELVARLAARGVRFLRNECARIAVDGGARGRAWIAFTGLEDLEEGKRVDLASARAGLRPGDIEVCLCHNPAGARWLAREGCVAILAGHTHGTQIDWPFLRTLGPKHPGTRLQLGPTTLLVSRGLGVVGAPLRIGAPAEVVVLRLERA